MKVTIPIVVEIKEVPSRADAENFGVVSITVPGAPVSYRPDGTTSHATPEQRSLFRALCNAALNDRGGAAPG